jgi:hypothetical protein
VVCVAASLACGSPGASSLPPDAGAPIDEYCHATDDLGARICDAERAGCRVPMHRSNHPDGSHQYTDDVERAACCDFTVEVFGYFFLYVTGAPDLVPLSLCMRGDDRFYTTEPDCSGVDGVTQEERLGWMSQTTSCGSIPLYWLRHPEVGEFLTTSDSERAMAVGGHGYAELGIVGYVWSEP